MSARTAKFSFGPVRQDTGDKHLRQGDLVEAINVRQTKRAGVYTKRKGFDRTAMTTTGGALSGTPTSVVSGSFGSTMMRDTGNQLWYKTGSTWMYAGSNQRPWPTVNPISSLGGKFGQPPQSFSCVVGSNLWVFALQVNTYKLLVLDIATGQAVSSGATINASGINAASAAYPGGDYVWMFWVSSSTPGVVFCHKIAVATPSFATASTTFYTFPASPTDVSSVPLQQVQAKYFTVVDKIVVIASGGASAGGGNFKRACVHAALNTATGTATSANLSVAYNGVLGSWNMGGLCILEGQDGSGTYWYYSMCGGIEANGYQYTALVRVTLANFATFTTYKLSGDLLAATAKAANTAGFVDSVSGAQVVVTTRRSTSEANLLGVSEPFYITNLYHRTSGGTITDDTAIKRSLTYSWVASGFATSGGKWYLVTGYDDFGLLGATAMTAERLSVQRAFHVREIVVGASAAECTEYIQAQFSVSEAAALWHRSSATYSTSDPITTVTPPLHATASGLLSVVALGQPTDATVDVALARIELAKVYGRECQVMGRALAPGNIPIVWDAFNAPHETSPLLFPPCIYVTGGAGSTYNIAAAVYTIVDSDRVVWRSAPFVLNATIGTGAALNIPNPFFRLPNTTVLIDVYLGTSGVAKRQGFLVPSDSVAYSTWTTTATLVEGETLYTLGGALSATWPVPCQSVAFWRNRVFLAQKNRIWPSLELEAGFGPLWNEVQTVTWGDEQGDITAMGAVDWNYLGILSGDRCGAIGGAGPDGRGNGNYSVMTLKAMMGSVAGDPVQQGPQGLYFKDSNLYHINVISTDLSVVESAGGAYDYASFALSCSAWYDAENMVVFFSSAQKSVIVIDYQHTDDAAPFGRCYLWTFTTLTPVAAGIDSSGLYVLDNSAQIFRPGNNWHDEKFGGTDLYSCKLTTGQLQFGDLQGEMSISKVQALVNQRSACSVKLTTYPNYASRTLSDPRVKSKSFTLATPTNAGDPANVSTRPEKCARIQGLAVSIEDAAAVDAEGFEFEGLAIEFTVTGRLLQPNVGRAS